MRGERKENRKLRAMKNRMRLVGYKWNPPTRSGIRRRAQQRPWFPTCVRVPSSETRQKNTRLTQRLNVTETCRDPAEIPETFAENTACIPWYTHKLVLFSQFICAYVIIFVMQQGVTWVKYCVCSTEDYKNHRWFQNIFYVPTVVLFLYTASLVALIKNRPA